ncbi:MAG: diguanylate cyclase [Treponema sp.]|nr:diguanylate cyclase [Treponema sp.]
MGERRKSSLAAKIAVICLGVTFLTAGLLSAVFIINARRIIQQQATISTVDNVHALRDQLVARFAEWEALVRFTAVAASSVITQDPFDHADLQVLFRRVSDLEPDVKLVYASSNVRWTEPDGFVVREDGLLPPFAWDNRERPWFLAAKANPGIGNIGHSDPYFDAITGELTISVSTNIYDQAGRDLGVIAADVGLAFLNALLDEKAVMPEHSIVLIDRRGRFITHADIDAVLTADFFGDSGLTRYRNDVLGRPSFMSYGRDVFIYSEVIPGLDWILVSVIPVAAIFAEMNRFVLHMILVGVALLAVAAIVSTLFTHRELIVPIRNINRAATSLVGMDFGVDIKKTENDEIGEIQDSMIKIRDNLKKGIEDIRTTHDKDMRAMREQQAAFRERTQAILDASPLVCAIYNGDGDIVDVNREVVNMLGIPDQKTFVSNYNRFLPKSQPDGSDSVAKSMEMLKNAMRDGNARYEWTYMHNDGSMVPTEEIVNRINIDGKPHAIVYSRDLRDYYREREKDRIVQGKLQAMMGQFNEYVEEQSASVATSSSATEEMIANVRSVTDTLSKNTQNVRELEEASVAGHRSLSEVVADIQGVVRESESLLEINAVMQNIASQTNLLSMNAAIEAAHAGESGRGFAVVADEIRKLAESASRQSKTIGGVLKSIKGSIDKITKSTDVVLGKFDAIEDGVKTVAVQEDSVLNAMEEQGHGGKQVLRAVGSVNDVTHKVKEAARRMVETSRENMHKADDSDTRAFTDALTGVRNREYFMETAEQELRYCVEQNRDFYLAMFSIDNLRQIADTHGNDMRDEVLKVMTMRVRNGLKQGTLLARYGDEEFVISLPNVRHGTAVKLVEQAQKKIKDAPFATRGLQLDVSISFGLASKTQSLAGIIANAQKALSSAKAAGRNEMASFG